MTAPLGLTWDSVNSARIIDLAHPLERGMPVSPNHPAYQYAMMRRHGDMVRSDGGSAANEMFLLGGHVGTHIDALGHVSQDGLLYGGIDASSSQSNQGLARLGRERVEQGFMINDSSPNTHPREDPRCRLDDADGC